MKLSKKKNHTEIKLQQKTVQHNLDFETWERKKKKIAGVQRGAA